MTAGEPTTARPLASAIAGFAVLCGVLLLSMGTGDRPRSEPSEPRSHVEAPDGASAGEGLRSALDATRSARRAIDSSNYGEVRRHLDSVERSLTEALARTSPPNQ